MSKTILVVEDDYDSRNAIVFMLEAMGYTARAFESGDAAIKELKEDSTNGRSVELALLDIMLPGMNGYEVMQEFKKIPQYAQVPIIMVTAKDADAEIIEGYKYGADYYITKPFTSKQLEYGLKLYL